MSIGALQGRSNRESSASTVLRLRFIIIGASVAGLACAYSLRQAGHSVRVVEALAEHELGTSPGGVRIPPNMSKILLRWGLDPESEKKMGSGCPEILCRSGYTGELIGRILFHKQVMEVMESNFYLMHHGDLVVALYNLAVDAGAHFDFGSKVTAVHSNGPSVILSTGEEIFGDIVIGADGDQSIVRSALLDGVEDDKEGYFTSFLFTVSTSRFSGDEELMNLTKEPLWNIWMGSGWAALVTPVREGSELAVTFYKEDRESTAQKGWKQAIPAEDLGFDTFGFDPTLERIMKLAGDVVQAKDVVHAHMENWFDGRGHLLIVGEASHPINPAGNHAAALGVEDAVVLGGLFSRLKSRSQIKPLLTAYQEMREPRCHAVRVSDDQKLALVTLPPGPFRDARDATMRKEREVGILELAKSPDEYLRASLEEFRVFGYDAFEEVATWWVEWGVLLERMNQEDEIFQNSASGGRILVESQRDVH